MSVLTQEEIASRPWGLEETIEYLGVGRNTVLDLFKSGKIKAKKVGRTWRTTKAHVDAYMEADEPKKKK